jgi:hypothetical protein
MPAWPGPRYGAAAAADGRGGAWVFGGHGLPDQKDWDPGVTEQIRHTSHVAATPYPLFPLCDLWRMQSIESLGQLQVLWQLQHAGGLDAGRLVAGRNRPGVQGVHPNPLSTSADPPGSRRAHPEHPWIL